jgi:hypothetical protein
MLAIAAFNALSAACWQSGAAKGYQLQTGVVFIHQKLF